MPEMPIDRRFAGVDGARGRSTLLPFAFTFLRYEEVEATCRTGLAAAKRSPFSEKRSAFWPKRSPSSDKTAVPEKETAVYDTR